MNSITPKKILFISAVLLILSCCTTTSNSRIINFYGDDNPNDISKKLLRSISASSQTKDFHLIYFDDDTNKTNIFLEGARTSFFFQKSLEKNRREISFKKIIFEDLCKEVTNSTSYKIIVFPTTPDLLNANCLNNYDSNLLLVYLEEKKDVFNNNFISLNDQNFFEGLVLNDLFANEDYLFITKNINEIEKLRFALKGKEIKYNPDNFLLIEDSKNFEDEIASAFDLKNSEKRRNNLQKTIDQDLKFISRSRKDISKVILSSSSDIANRIIPAFKYNLLFDLEIYNLPNHFDVWKETSSMSDLEGTYGLEFPILVNRINLGNKNFFSYSPESKINYSLGFDLINFINRGNNYFGLLGAYYYSKNQIKIQPINVSFEEGKLIQSLN
tara:strand:+ start:384 stop:1538 length:1155 start_codon:yes stop_codon:yes gene_type:complete